MNRLWERKTGLSHTTHENLSERPVPSVFRPAATGGLGGITVTKSLLIQLKHTTRFKSAMVENTSENVFKN